MKIRTKFYKGEETNPFPPEMDEHYFWELEKRNFGPIFNQDLPPEELIYPYRGFIDQVRDWLCGFEEPPPDLKNVNDLDISLLHVFTSSFFGAQQIYGAANPVTGKPFDYSKYSN